MFPVALWNVHNRTVNGDSRTNNAAEAGHWQIQVWLQPPKKKKYVTVDTRIRAVLEDYDLRKHLIFLRSVAHNLGH